jgi:hypothetical protein
VPCHHRQRGVLAPRDLVHPRVDADGAGDGEPPHAPHRRRLECVEQAEGVGAEVLDRIGQVVAGRREVHDAGDLVPLPDTEEGRLVRGVQRLDDDPAAGLVGEVLRQLGGPVRGEHDGFAQVEQCPRGVRPDRTQAAGDEYQRLDQEVGRSVVRASAASASFMRILRLLL